MNAIKAHPSSDAYASIEDIIEYLDLMSQKGDFKASFNLGRIYYEGQRGLDRDFELARQYFFAVTQRFWKKGRVVDNYKPGLDKTAEQGFRLHRTHVSAWGWSRAKLRPGEALVRARAAVLRRPISVRPGLDAAERVRAAQEHPQSHRAVQGCGGPGFRSSAGPAWLLYLDQGHTDDLSAANHYFELAARYGNIEAYYYLAEMNYVGVGRDKSCSAAVNFYKTWRRRPSPWSPLGPRPTWPMKAVIMTWPSSNTLAPPSK